MNKKYFLFKFNIYICLPLQEETVSALELEYEIMAKITSAALKLANESTARKGVRRQRKLSYQQSAHRLRELEHKLKQARSKAVATASTLPKQKKKPRPLSDSEGNLAILIYLLQKNIQLSRYLPYTCH